MKYVTEFRNVRAIRSLSHQIESASTGAELTFMEVCGTHTMAIARFGIRQLLRENIRLLSGPGCPVCVTPNEYLDTAIALARQKNVIITTFGDMMRVPGSTSSLEKEKATGREVQIVYSPIDALDIAENNKGKEVIFLSVGFETTVPVIAVTLMMAINRGIMNFSVLTANKVVPPALEALLQNERKLDGFILPGHVSTIIGAKAYNKLVSKHHIPCCITGFEPTDILESILDLIKQNTEHKPNLQIQYKRVVTIDGNMKAQKLIKEVFRPVDANWRGIGVIKNSGLELNPSFVKFDASKKFTVKVEETREEKGCICGQILQGLASPHECPLFGGMCTPEDPVGACMVSSEGTCAAWYKYHGNE